MRWAGQRQGDAWLGGGWGLGGVEGLGKLARTTRQVRAETVGANKDRCLARSDRALPWDTKDASSATSRGSNTKDTTSAILRNNAANNARPRPSRTKLAGRRTVAPPSLRGDDSHCLSSLMGTRLKLLLFRLIQRRAALSE